MKQLGWKPHWWELERVIGNDLEMILFISILKGVTWVKKDAQGEIVAALFTPAQN